MELLTKKENMKHEFSEPLAVTELVTPAFVRLTHAAEHDPFIDGVPLNPLDIATESLHKTAQIIPFRKPNRRPMLRIIQGGERG